MFIVSKIYDFVTGSSDNSPVTTELKLDGGNLGHSEVEEKEAATTRAVPKLECSKKENSYTIAASSKEDSSFSEVQNEIGTTNSKNGNSDSSDTKCIYGEITSLFSGRGLIDDHIYFSQDSIIGFERLQIGDKVSVEASRINPEGGWIAKRVSLINEWKTENETTNTVDEMLGMVTYFMKGSGLINEKYTFSRNCCEDGYNPIVNDFVKYSIKMSSTSEEIISVKPVRENKFVGTITDTVNRYGFIDNDIYFHISACVGSYKPKKGDQVQVVAIESKQRKSNWRATKVEKFNTSLQSTAMADSTEINGRYVEFLLKPKNGITLTNEIDFGDVEIGKILKENIKVRNNGTKEHTVLEYKFFRSSQQLKITFSQVFSQSTSFKNSPKEKLKMLSRSVNQGGKIMPEEENYLQLQFQAKLLGKHENIAILDFGGFKIGCRIRANVYDPQQLYIGPKTAFSYRKTTAINDARLDECRMLPAQRPLQKKKMFLPKHLPPYEIPKNIKEYILNDDPLEDIVPEILFPLTMKNHRRKLSTLLYAEEIYQEQEMRQFDMQMVTLRPFADFLILSVPGLAEGRPSLLMGDRVILEIHGSAAGTPIYEGCIHEVRAEEILLKFNEAFHKIYRNEDCNVQFFFNRTPIKRSHQAIEHAIYLGEEVLFPTMLQQKNRLMQVKQKRGISFVNKTLNERQKCAIEHILAAECRPTPYILFGPPGTGKTITLVEAILQVHRNISSSRILACAPSNSASDLIAQRLLESSRFSKGDLIRLNAFQRAQEIHENLLPFCTSDTDDLMLSCRYRIIVCTCTMAGILYSAGLESGHFTHVFIDEAGQSTEPEVLIPMGLVAGNEDGQIVLAGDPYQLGPVLSSSIALEYGLSLSLLERLMSRSPYQRDVTKYAEHGCYNPLLVTKLVQNYRSHEMLLDLSSSLFYHHELEPCASPQIANTFVNWSLLPKKNFPIIFHGVRGEDVREGNSPSWFNPAEAVQVLNYVQMIMSLNNTGFSLEDIGIITPYRKQVEKIRLLLEKVNMSGIKVGSVEEFQGQERQAIIISTVRSNESFLSFDERHTLGFLSNPKRFNVAITRSQSLLVVVGNPHILCLDPYWCSLIQYCVAHSAFIGCDLPSLSSPLIKKNFLQALILLGVTGKAEESSDVEVSYNGEGNEN